MDGLITQQYTIRDRTAIHVIPIPYQSNNIKEWINDKIPKQTPF